jgi:hypothetical protein
VIIGSSAGIGAAIGGAIKGGKGALIGAAIGAVARRSGIRPRATIGEHICTATGGSREGPASWAGCRPFLRFGVLTRLSMMLRCRGYR